MTKHTPGPWEIKIIDLGWNAYANLIVAPSAEPQYRVIAEARSAATPQQEDANARLIAAAPDLLAACEIALIAILSIARDAEARGAALVDDTGSTQKLRAAIARAKGEEGTP